MDNGTLFKLNKLDFIHIGFSKEISLVLKLNYKIKKYSNYNSEKRLDK